MKIITEPSVQVINRQVIDEHQLDAFLGAHDVHGWDTDTECGGEKTIEVGGRLCYMSFAKPRPGGNAAYLKHIKESGHGSVLEHACWSFIFSGVSRTLSHELVRHRAGFAYSQLSQRYVDESVCEVVVPKDLQDEVAAAEAMQAWVGGYMESTVVQVAEAMEKFYAAHPTIKPDMIEAGCSWLAVMDNTSDVYQNLTNYLFAKKQLVATTKAKGPLTQEEKTAVRKDARQAARSVLPNATETKLVVTANARALRHFIEMRGSKFAEPEIRMLAFKVWKILVGEAFNLFGDYQWTTEGTDPKNLFPLDVFTPTKKV